MTLNYRNSIRNNGTRKIAPWKIAHHPNPNTNSNLGKNLLESNLPGTRNNTT